MSENDTSTGGTDHTVGEDCPYCDGQLTPIEKEGYNHAYECSNGADCPATFVAVIQT